MENEKGKKVKMKQGAQVDVIIEAEDKDTTPKNESA